MSRKFSDSEIRAYTKNRHEDKMLRSKLDKLKLDISTFHDSTAKQRQDLVAECKGLRMTTGGSPVPGNIICDNDFDISKRVQRPWAYSVMETTYNAAYRDAVIPFPKQKRARPKSDMTGRTFTSRSVFSSSENAFTSKESTSNKWLSVSSSSEGAIKGTESINAEHKHPLDYHLFQMDHSPKITLSEKSKTAPEIKIDLVDQTVNENAPEHDEMSKSPRSESESNLTKTDDDDQETVRTPRAPIFLPPVYKIMSQEYQDAERARTIQRSKSRVSFSSQPTSLSESYSKTSNKEKHKPSSPDTAGTSHAEKIEHSKDAVEVVNVTGSTASLEKSDIEKSKYIVTLDPDSYHDIRTRKLDEVMYRGRRLKNYIHPEDRYKIDPIIMKRRQNKMDKLAKESMSFLKRVNHENIKVEIAFPRSARKRILLKLVEENNSVKGRRVCDSDGPLIQKKIEYFMSSMSNYIKQQQLDREQTYS